MHVFWEGHKNWWIWQYVVTVKLTVKFSSIFVGFLENMNFTKDSKANHTWALSIVKFWHVFCTILLHFYSRRSGPGPLGPVRKILVVRSGPEGPHFTRSVGTLEQMSGPEISWYGKSILGCGLWPGLDRGKKGSGPILSNFFGWFFQFFMGKKKKFKFFLHFSVRTEKLHKIKLKFFKKCFGKKFYLRKTSFF